MKYSEKLSASKRIIQYEIVSIDSNLLEGEYLFDLQVKETKIKDIELLEQYLIVPTN